jgi:hypothetical protein
MPNVLFAIKSCQAHRDAGYHDIIMNTWGKDVENIRFFQGLVDGGLDANPKSPLDVCLNVPDDYMSLPVKTRAISSWSVLNDYDFTFFCDTDTFLVPRLLLQSGFEKFDYSGRFGAMPAIGDTFYYRDPQGVYPNCHPWASGGVGYFLSKKAAAYIAESKPEVWAEDMFVGQCLGPRIQAGEVSASDLPIECQSAWHFPRRQFSNECYNPKFVWMESMYAEHR